MDEHERIEIEREVDRLVEALDAERHRHVAGLELAPSLTPHFQGSSRAAHRETAAALRAAGEAGLAARVAALRAERVQAGEEEAWRAAESGAVAIGPDGRVGIVGAERALAGEPDPERRAAFARAAAEGCEQAARPREAAAEARARARAEVGLAPDWQAVVDGDQLLAASDDAWRDVLAYTAGRELERERSGGGGLRRAELLRALSLERWSGLFKAGMLPLALRGALEPLGLDPGRARVDGEVRPGKWPGVHVHGARVSFGPRGGAPDWLDLFDGIGRALAASHAPPHRRDAAFAHALGWLLSSLLLEPRFLSERCDVDRRGAREPIRALALRRLFGLRARGAALRVATEVERGLSGRAWRDGYREAMTAAAGADWEAVRAARDADGDAHRAALAGAGQGEALRRAMIERFDEDWWRNPRSAGHLAAVLASGSLTGAEAPPALAAAALTAALEGGG